MNVAGERTPKTRPKPLSKEAIINSTKKNKKSTKKPIKDKTKSKDKTEGKPKSTRSRKRKQSSNADAIKLVVRLLPPNLDQNKFWEQVNVSDVKIIDKYYVKGSYPNKPFKLPTYSRAYINFKNVQFCDRFIKQFQHQSFEDEKESTIPNFISSFSSGMCNYDSFKESDELAGLPAYQLFLKFFNGEIERPTTFLKAVKEDSNKDTDKNGTKGKDRKKSDQGTDTDDSSKKSTKNEENKKRNKRKKKVEGKNNKTEGKNESDKNVNKSVKSENKPKNNSTKKFDNKESKSKPSKNEENNDLKQKFKRSKREKGNASKKSNKPDGNNNTNNIDSVKNEANRSKQSSPSPAPIKLLTKNSETTKDQPSKPKILMRRPVEP